MEQERDSNLIEGEKEPVQIPFFVAENQIMHMDKSNKRMLCALLAVCITFILTIIIFVVGYTVREQNWLDTVTEIKTPVVEVADAESKTP